MAEIADRAIADIEADLDEFPAIDRLTAELSEVFEAYSAKHKARG